MSPVCGCGCGEKANANRRFVQHHQNRKGRLCEVEGCHRKHYGKGRCVYHYNRECRGPRPGRTYTIDELPEETFWASIDIADEDECWLWLGCTRYAYGFFRVRKVNWQVHRYAYTLAVGPIPEGHVVHHNCQNKLCVNPRHLEPMTASAHRIIHINMKRELSE